MISDEPSDAHSNTNSNTSFQGIASNDILRTVLLVELLSHSSHASHTSSIQSKHEESTTKSEANSIKDDTTHTSETHSKSALDNIVMGFFSVLCIGSIVGCLFKCFDETFHHKSH